MRLRGAIIDAAVKVHRALGPGLLESAYEACLTYELRKRGLKTVAKRPCRLFMRKFVWTRATEWIW